MITEMFNAISKANEIYIVIDNCPDDGWREVCACYRNYSDAKQHMDKSRAAGRECEIEVHILQ